MGINLTELKRERREKRMAKRTANEVRTDLLLIKSLAQSLKASDRFHSSLEAQAQAIIDKINIIDYDLENLPFAEESEVEGTVAKLNPETGKIERVPVPETDESRKLVATPGPGGSVVVGGKFYPPGTKVTPEGKIVDPTGKDISGTGSSVSPVPPVPEVKK